jgi:hypothetical protein
MRTPCCSGNIFTVVGETPRGGFEACADAMGVDRGHMSFATLRKALPPDYVSFLAGRAAMQSLRDDYGLPVVSYSTSLSDPLIFRRQLKHWLRGAGGRSASLGAELLPAELSLAEPGPIPGPDRASMEEQVAATQHAVELELEGVAPPPSSGLPGLATIEPPVMLSEVSFRELEHSCGGGFTQSVLEDGAHDWL